MAALTESQHVRIELTAAALEEADTADDGASEVMEEISLLGSRESSRPQSPRGRRTAVRKRTSEHPPDAVAIDMDAEVRPAADSSTFILPPCVRVRVPGKLTKRAKNRR